MIDLEKIKAHIREEIEFHSRQANNSPNQNSPWFAMHMGAADALMALLEFIND